MKILQTKKQTNRKVGKTTETTNDVTLYIMKRLRKRKWLQAVIRKSFAFTHILCFANDFVLINKSVYECKHSTQIC